MIKAYDFIKKCRVRESNNEHELVVWSRIGNGNGGKWVWETNEQAALMFEAKPVAKRFANPIENYKGLVSTANHRCQSASRHKQNREFGSRFQSRWLAAASYCLRWLQKHCIRIAKDCKFNIFLEISWESLMRGNTLWIMREYTYM